MTSVQMRLKMRGKKLVVSKGGLKTSPKRSVAPLDLEDKLDRIIHNFRKKNDRKYA